VKVKICGVTRPTDAQLAEESGAHYVGAVLVPGSPRQVSPELAGTLAGSVTIPLVVVVAGLSPRQTANLARVAGASVIQLHGEEAARHVHVLRELGDWELWKAVRVRTSADITEAADTFGEVVDLLLLDAWHPSALGGTGTSFDWSEAAACRSRLSPGLRLGVAGGLTPENVGEVVRLLAPDLVDVVSGVEASPGIKDPDRVRSFVRRARGNDFGAPPAGT